MLNFLDLTQLSGFFGHDLGFKLIFGFGPELVGPFTTLCSLYNSEMPRNLYCNVLGSLSNVQNLVPKYLQSIANVWFQKSRVSSRSRHVQVSVWSRVFAQSLGLVLVSQRQCLVSVSASKILTETSALLSSSISVQNLSFENCISKIISFDFKEHFWTVFRRKYWRKNRVILYPKFHEPLSALLIL